jgi:hypothetical protein
MKTKSKLNKIKSIRELSLYRQNLEYQEKILEQKVAGISANIVDNFTDKLRDFTFNLTTRLITQFFSKRKKSKQ